MIVYFLNKKKIEKVLNKVLNLLSRNKFTQEEVVVLYGNLGLALGASMAECTRNMPTVRELHERYENSPTIDVAMMLNGLNVASWVSKDTV